jgi:hypothetical protein
MMRSSETNNPSFWGRLGLLLIVSISLLFLGYGCTPSQSEGSLSLDLSYFAQKQGGLTSQDAKSFRVRVFPNSPPETSLDPLYDSGCLDLKGTAFRIAPLMSGTNRSVDLYVYSEKSCQKDDLSYLAYRGGLHIEDGIEKMYTLVPLRVGGFSTLPVPSQATRDKAWATECTGHDECRQEVHPAAFCVIQDGHCALISLYPLNSYAPRAFHKTVRLSLWDHVTVGGIGSASGGALIGTDTLVENYSAAQTLFEVPFIDKFSSETRVSFHDVVRLDDRRFLSVGGVQTFNMDRLNDSILFDVDEQVCTRSNNCFDNLLRLAHVVDVNSKKAKASVLPAAIFLARVVVTGKGGSEILITGGLEFQNSEEGIVASDRLHRCEVASSDNSITCATLEQKLACDRVGHELLCIDSREDGSCNKTIIAGGYDAPPGLVADLYNSEQGTIESLIVEEEISVPGGWKWVRTDKAILAFGGTTGDFGDPANVPPYRVVYNDGRIEFVPLDLGSLDVEKTYRNFHDVAVTPEGVVLVIGGLDSSNQATSSVLRFTDSGEYIDEVHMAVPRFGHSATVIQSGPMYGSVLVQGGAVFNDGDVDLLGGSEIYRDAP